MVDVAIIGAGISGLTSAYYLKRAGLDVQVYEAAATGGAVQTRRVGPYLLEAGPNSLRDDTPAVRDLVHQLDLEQEIVTPTKAARSRYLLREGELVATPTGPLDAFTTRLLPFSEKLKVLREPWVVKGIVDDESIREFVSRRLSPWIADHIVDPVITGIYAGDISKLSMRSSFPKIWEFEKARGSIIRGAMAARKHKPKPAPGDPPRRNIFSFRNGLHTLTDKLREELGERVHHASIRSIEQEATGYRLHGDAATQAKRVILANPAYRAAALLRPLDTSLANALQSIEHPHVGVVSLAFKRTAVRRSTDGFGFLVPSNERRDILGCIFISSLWPGRAPEDEILLTVMVGGSRRPDMTGWTDEQLQIAALREVTAILDIHGDPVFTHLTRWQRAIPQYHVGHHKIIEQVERFESAFPGIHLLSNYRGGISVGSCVRSAETLTRRLISNT